MVKAFKTKDIEYTYTGPECVWRGFGLVNGQIDLLHDPDKHSAVYSLHERIPDVSCTLRSQCHCDALSASDDGTSC